MPSVPVRQVAPPHHNHFWELQSSHTLQTMGRPCLPSTTGALGSRPVRTLHTHYKPDWIGYIFDTTKHHVARCYACCLFCAPAGACGCCGSAAGWRQHGLYNLTGKATFLTLQTWLCQRLPPQHAGAYRSVGVATAHTLQSDWEGYIFDITNLTVPLPLGGAALCFGHNMARFPDTGKGGCTTCLTASNK